MTRATKSEPGYAVRVICFLAIILAVFSVISLPSQGLIVQKSQQDTLQTFCVPGIKRWLVMKTSHSNATWHLRFVERTDFGFLFARALVNSSAEAHRLVRDSSSSLAEHVYRATGGNINIYGSELGNLSVWIYPVPQYDGEHVSIVGSEAGQLRCEELPVCLNYDRIETCSEVKGARENSWVETSGMMRTLAVGAALQSIPTLLGVLVALAAHRRSNSCRANATSCETRCEYAVVFVLHICAMSGVVWSYAHVPRLWTRNHAVAWQHMSFIEFQWLLASATPDLHVNLFLFLFQRTGMLATTPVQVALLLYSLGPCMQGSSCYSSIRASCEDNEETSAQHPCASISSMKRELSSELQTPLLHTQYATLPNARLGASCPSTAEMGSKSRRHGAQARTWDTRLRGYDIEQGKQGYSICHVQIYGDEQRGAAGVPNLVTNQTAERGRINGVSFSGESRSWFGSIFSDATLFDCRSDETDSASDLDSLTSFAELELEPDAARWMRPRAATINPQTRKRADYYSSQQAHTQSDCNRPVAGQLPGRSSSCLDGRICSLLDELPSTAPTPGQRLAAQDSDEIDVESRYFTYLQASSPLPSLLLAESQPTDESDDEMPQWERLPEDHPDNDIPLDAWIPQLGMAVGQRQEVGEATWGNTESDGDGTVTVVDSECSERASELLGRDIPPQKPSKPHTRPRSAEVLDWCTPRGKGMNTRRVRYSSSPDLEAGVDGMAHDSSICDDSSVLSFGKAQLRSEWDVARMDPTVGDLPPDIFEQAYRHHDDLRASAERVTDPEEELETPAGSMAEQGWLLREDAMPLPDARDVGPSAALSAHEDIAHQLASQLGRGMSLGDDEHDDWDDDFEDEFGMSPWALDRTHLAHRPTGTHSGAVSSAPPARWRDWQSQPTSDSPTTSSGEELVQDSALPSLPGLSGRAALRPAEHFLRASLPSGLATTEQSREREPGVHPQQQRSRRDSVDSVLEWAGVAGGGTARGGESERESSGQYDN